MNSSSPMLAIDVLEKILKKKIDEKESAYNALQSFYAMGRNPPKVTFSFGEIRMIESQEEINLMNYLVAKWHENDAEIEKLMAQISALKNEPLIPVVAKPGELQGEPTDASDLFDVKKEN